MRRCMSRMDIRGTIPTGKLRELILGSLDYPQKTMPSFVGKLTEGEP